MPYRLRCWCWRWRPPTCTRAGPPPTAYLPSQTPYLDCNERPKSACCRQEIAEQAQPFRAKCIDQMVHPGHVAIWSREVIYESDLYWVGAHGKHDENQRSGRLGRKGRGGVKRRDHRHITMNQIGRECW